MTGQRGLAAAVGTDDGRKGPLPDGGGYIGEGIKLLSLFRLKGMGQMTDIKKNVSTLFFILHTFFLHVSSFLCPEKYKNTMILYDNRQFLFPSMKKTVFYIIISSSPFVNL